MPGAVAPDLPHMLRAQGAALEIGPFIVRLRSRLPAMAESIGLHYAEQLLPADTPFCDFHVRLDRAPGVRGVWRPQARFYLDGSSPFKPLPLAQAFPLFEWGLNWCIAQHGHHYLMIHAAVVARDDRALILPGAPGAGKSTLAAALALSGWRLLSDEFALLSLEDGMLSPLPRPVSLKNQAIPLIRERFPQAVLGRSTHDTTKGTVAHLKPPEESIARSQVPAQPAWLVFPRFAPEGKDALRPMPKAHSLLTLADAAFNYSVLGGQGFEAAADLIDRCACFELDYADLDRSLHALTALTDAP
ncbi:Hpr(Ser) kinase/phosphatase [Alkalilimnicola ehrlichii MLHE-1]|uniref:Hpr(Ser) kinase/phosphatase n=2 Tax=Alkalilimnicola ehrlichii TaxID=351052 RepID=Q0ACH8_ALKEH|nr:Hpr(Ser) kinase/phosphatase [Alkalilimnicola ehrlichii MLHE-1]